MNRRDFEKGRGKEVLGEAEGAAFGGFLGKMGIYPVEW